MPKNSIPCRLVVAVAAFCLLLAGTAGAQQSDDTVKVRVKKIIKACAGDDCDGDREVRRVVFIGKDGEKHRLLGDDLTWISADGENTFISAEGAHSWVSADGDHLRMMVAGHAPGAFLGVQMTELTAELRTHFGVPEDVGVMVSKVVEDSPAFRAGVRVGDIISAVDGDDIKSASGLSKAIGAREGGESVNLELWRDGRLQTLSAALEEGKHFRQSANVFVIGCEGDDCESSGHSARIELKHFSLGDHGFDCGSDECEIQVQCYDGDCSCTVNGEATACDELHLEHQ